jgi:hypothetical protein
MDCEKILAQLRGELDLIDQAIVRLENLAREGKRGRGRPPAWMTKRTQNGPRVPQTAAHMKVVSEP